MKFSLWASFLALVGCAHVAPVDVVPPHETFTLASKVLAEDRVINVALPVGYDGKTRFDVVYMPDGAIDEDFPHIANALSGLLSRGEIVPVVLVGIPNTVRRRDLTGPTEVASDREVAPVIGGSEKFRRFIREELIPEIERRYAVSATRSIIGESLAGLFVMETFFLEREPSFHGYAAISPSLWWNDHALVRHAPEQLATWGSRTATLYLSAADETDINEHTDALEAVLKTSAPAGLRWSYDPRKQEKHSTIFRATELAALRWLLARP